MSELQNLEAGRSGLRRALFSTVSSLTLATSMVAASAAQAGDGDSNHPTVWIDLGGQLEQVEGTGDRFAPPFAFISPTPAPYSDGNPVDFQKPARFSYGAEGSLTIQPSDSDWVFSASIRYGRSNNKRDVHHQSTLKKAIYDPLYASNPSAVPKSWIKYGRPFGETLYRHSESHLLLDFQAGKDVGLGLFGRGSTSVLSIGVRVAQFSTHSEARSRAKPSVTFYTQSLGFLQLPWSKWNTYYSNGSADRSFNGIGPSLSWKSSDPVMGNVEEGQVSIDWGLSGALLFGRQKARVSHQTTGRYFRAKYTTQIPTSVYVNGHQNTNYTTLYKHAAARSQSRSVTVPNLGAFAGISYRVNSAKLSLGYRAEFFFGAVDTGIDKRRTENLILRGPYASISIGFP